MAPHRLVQQYVISDGHGWRKPHAKIVTPKDVIATRSVYPRPRGIYWDLLRTIQINAIPLLRKRMRQGNTGTRQG